METKDVKEIFEGIRVDGVRKRPNKELEELYNNPSIGQLVKRQRARWLRTLVRTADAKIMLLEQKRGKEEADPVNHCWTRL